MPMLFPTSPTVGQVFTSGGRSWVWSGATWDSPTATNTLLAPYGMTHINTTPFSNTSSVIIDNLFTTDFDAYQVIVTCLSSSGGHDVTMQFRAGGTTKTANYQDVGLQIFSTSTGVTSRSAQANAMVGRFDTNGGVANVLINGPALATRTYGLSTSYDSLSVVKQFGFQQTETTAFTGLVVNMTSATGDIKVYGMRK